MPTGYTSTIVDGISFEEFVLQCARAFGALITLRDEPQDAPIPEIIEPSNYHNKEIIKIMQEAKELELLSETEADEKANQEYKEKLRSKTDSINKALELRKKYMAMLIQVKNWVPPSPDHIGLKNFMIEQIESSIEFDCKTDYYTNQQILPKTGKEWLAHRQQELLKDLAYHTRENEEEIQRAAGRTHWIKQLRENLTESCKIKKEIENVK